MKKMLFAIYGMMLVGLAIPSAAVTLSLQPASQTAAPGDPVTLELVVGGLGDFAPDSLGAFDVDIAYDSAALTFTGYTLDSYLGDIFLGEAYDVSGGDSGGVVNIAELSLLENNAATCFFCMPPYLDDIQPDSFTLAYLDFSVDTLAPGESTIVSIETVNALGDGAGMPLTVTATSDAVISAVPVPAAAWLFGSGLLAMIGLCRHKKL